MDFNTIWQVCKAMPMPVEAYLIVGAIFFSGVIIGALLRR
jgi:hypothetical protein